MQLSIERLKTVYWHEYEPSFEFDDDKLKHVMSIFKNFYVKNICKIQGKNYYNLSDKNSLNFVEEYVIKNNIFFFQIYKNPRFLFENQNYQANILNYSLTHNYIFLTSYLLHLNDDIEEDELNILFKNCLRSMNYVEIRKLIGELFEIFSSGNNDAGYYFLWVFKIYTETDLLTLPKKKCVNLKLVIKIFTDHFIKIIRSKNEKIFIELLFVELNDFLKSLYHSFNAKNKLSFHSLMNHLLTNHTISQWAYKKYILIEYLKLLSKNKKKIFLKEFLKSYDKESVSIGKTIYQILTATSFTRAIPLFYDLQKVFPQLEDRDIQEIFNYPFTSFHDKKPVFCNTLKLSRLCFNYNNEILTHEKMIIGIFVANELIGPYLLAFDRFEEELIWGIPLTNIDLGQFSYRLIKSENEIFIYTSNKILTIVNIKIGEVKAKFVGHHSLCLKNTIKYDSNSILYKTFINNNKLILQGSDRKNKIIFNIKLPETFLDIPLFSLSKFCGMLSSNNLLIVSPKGNFNIIRQCISAKSENNILYTIERKSKRSLSKNLGIFGEVSPKIELSKEKDETSNICYLCISELKNDPTVISPIKKIIEIYLPYVSIVEICENGWILLFSKKNEPIFVNIEMNRIYYGEIECSEYYLNKHSIELWTVNQFTQEIWKLTPENSISKGISPYGVGNKSSLVHVDDDSDDTELYFVEFPLKK